MKREATLPPGAPIDREHRRAQTELFVCFQRIGRAGERRVADLLARERVPNITPAQANALLVIFEERSPITARQLAARLSVSEVTAGRFAKALETGGWVERFRDREDSRAVQICPTRRARRWLPRFIRVANALMDEAFDGFDSAGLLELSRRVRRVQGNLEPSGGARNRPPKDPPPGGKLRGGR